MKPALFVSLRLLLGACASQYGELVDEDRSASAPISFRGTTELRVGRLLVSIPASAMPSGMTGCRGEAEERGRSGESGFEVNDIVWDVNIFCDKEAIRELFDSIRICILPQDGKVNGKLVYQQHATSFSALPAIEGESGYVCGLAGRLSLFTLGLAD